MDDDGKSIGGIEPHRLAIQPDCEDIRGVILAQNDALLQFDGWEVTNGNALAAYVADIVQHHREDSTIAANVAAWVAKEAERKARIAAQEAEWQAARDAETEQANAEEHAAQTSRQIAFSETVAAK